MERPQHDDPTSFSLRGRILDEEQSQPVDTSSEPMPRIGPTTDDFHPHIYSHAGNLGPLCAWEERPGCILGQTISSPSRLDLFGTISFPFQLDQRDQNLLFHCKLPALSFSRPYICLIYIR